MPGRPSGVSLAERRFSIPASQPQAMTEVAKPVRLRAAVSAHSGVSAVMIRRVARMPKASAKVSSMATPVDDHASAGPVAGWTASRPRPSASISLLEIRKLPMRTVMNRSK